MLDQSAAASSSECSTVTQTLSGSNPQPPASWEVVTRSQAYLIASALK